MKDKTVYLRAEEPEMDPNLLLLDGRDIRSVSRHERRAHGFRGPAFTHQSPSVQRFVSRHAGAITASPSRTRRQRKAVARIKRLVASRGLA